MEKEKPEGRTAASRTFAPRCAPLSPTENLLDDHLGAADGFDVGAEGGFVELREGELAELLDLLGGGLAVLETITAEFRNEQGNLLGLLGPRRGTQSPDEVPEPARLLQTLRVLLRLLQGFQGRLAETFDRLGRLLPLLVFVAGELIDELDQPGHLGLIQLLLFLFL